jgi:hypothetical protein
MSAMSPVKWGLIESGATFHALVGDLLLHDDPLTNIYNREGADGAIDALSGDRKTVFQSKHHKVGQATPAKAFADARREFVKIEEYRRAGHKWHDVWKDVTTWKLVSNVPFGTADDQRWNDEIVPAFAKLKLKAERVMQSQLEAMLTDHPAVADAFFGQRPRLFISLAEHREALVAREVLPRAYEVEIEGRATELDAITSFVRDSEYQVLLVHGPGGLGKSRLLLEAAYRLASDGSVATVYCGTPQLAASDNWYVGIVPEAKALVLLDEPIDARFVERFLAELRARTKQWKVVVAVRTPRDPVIRVLTDPRERLLAPPCELSPLPNETAIRYATTLLAPLTLSDDDRRRVTHWLAEVCGRVPIWMTVAVSLLERGADLRRLPRDEFEIAQGYLRDILEHTRPEIADARQLLQFLRWVALAQPVNRHSEAGVSALGNACSLDAGALERVIEDLIRRRVITAFGIRQRMMELRPDVMRDHILIDWLTVESGGKRQPSADARALAASLAGLDTPSGLATEVIRSLARLEFLVRPAVRFLDPIADAAVQRAESAASTLEQERALELAATLASARPGHLACVARSIRTLEVAETTEDTIIGPFTRSRSQIVDKLPWQLFIAAHGAASSEERQLILDELIALADRERDDRGFYKDGRSARELLPRVIQEHRGYRAQFHAEAAVAARRMLDALASGDVPMPSHRIVLNVLLSISRHDAYADDVDENTLHIETVKILPAGELGRIASGIRDRLWAIVDQPAGWSEARKLCWKLLDHFHSQLNQHQNEQAWRDLLVTDLERARAIAERQSTSLEDVQAARLVWRWHVKYERNDDIKKLAEDCETAYRAIPLVTRFAATFAAETIGSHLSDAARDFATPASVAELEAFFGDALRFVETHADGWRADRAVSFATWVGEFHASTQSVLIEFIESHLRAGPGDRLFEIAVAMASGYMMRLRAEADPDAHVAALDRLAACVRENDLQALLRALYVYPGPVSARRFSAVDYEFLRRHRNAFSSMQLTERFSVLGRVMPARHDALDLAIEWIGSMSDDDASTALGCIWHGYFETLPYPFTESDVSQALVVRLLDITAMLPDSRGPRGNLEWEIGEVMKHVPKVSLAWLLDLVRRRLDTFGARNQRRGRGVRLIHILPDNESFILDYVERIPDAPPTDEARQVVGALFALEDRDVTIENDLPQFLMNLDPHGRVVPDFIAACIADPLQCATIDELAHSSRAAGWYTIGSQPWRTIAKVACRRAASLEGEARWRVYSQLSSHHMESWSGKAGEIHPRWQAAVDDARRALADEEDDVLREYWEWSIAVAQDRLEVESGRIEERD